MKTYRYWAWLHKELVPYFYSYAYRMFESPNLRALRRGPMTYSLRPGNEIYAPIVTESTDSMNIELPSGQWVYYWDESVLVSGTLAGFPVPLGASRSSSAWARSSPWTSSAPRPATARPSRGAR